jgi:DNA-binding GntR family transcriptional regulator
VDIRSSLPRVRVSAVIVETQQQMVDNVKSGPVPRYYQLQEIIRERIRNGEWTPGSSIPSERELCERYGISRMTARQAISGLETEGLLYREQGKGTFVGQGVIAQQLLQLTGFTEDMNARQRNGMKGGSPAIAP